MWGCCSETKRGNEAGSKRHVAELCGPAATCSIFLGTHGPVDLRHVLASPSGPGATLVRRLCYKRTFRLRPTPTIHILAYCLAVALEKTGVVLHAVCFASLSSSNAKATILKLSELSTASSARAGYVSSSCVTTAALDISHL
jgi:hypothetical protein